MTKHEEPTESLAVRLDALIEEGLTLHHCLAAFSARQGERCQALLDAAADHPLLEGGTLEVDDIVSADEADLEEGEGSYVLAWLWVDPADE